MKHIHKNTTSFIDSPNQKNEVPRVFAREISRELNKSELKRVAGAGHRTRECWDTHRADSIFTVLDCNND
jgi:hypothetical protein